MRQTYPERSNEMGEKNNLRLDEKEKLALERTRLARVRTQLAWIRTILAVVVFIIVMFKIMKGW